MNSRRLMGFNPSTFAGQCGVVRYSKINAPMSALGQKQTLDRPCLMSALPQKQTFPGDDWMSALCQKRKSPLGYIEGASAESFENSSGE
jgi:hypothetical protein